MSTTLRPKIPSKYVQKEHPESQILGDQIHNVQTRRKLVGSSICTNLTLFEPKNTSQASKDKFWVRAMNEELDQIENNNTWDLVPRPEEKNIIGTKWVLKNKLNEQGQVIRNNVLDMLLINFICCYI